MKKYLALILAFVMVFALGAVSVSAADGRVTATGVGQGIDGNVVVEIEADANTINSVTVLEQNETPGIGSVAVESSLTQLSRPTASPLTAFPVRP